MCAIIILKKGQMIPKDMLYTAVYNNWHSYGLVTKVDGKLDIKKSVPKSGEVNPKEVFDLLEADKNYERILHLRHNTAGATNLDNTHPFEVFFDEKSGRHVVFMHNGTLYPYVSKMTTTTGSTVDDPNGPSDSKNFADRVIIPLLSSFDGGNGKGDISSRMVREIINKFWGGSNRGILIANDQDSFLIDMWKTVGPEGNKFLASNDDYFETIKRGPEHERRLESRKKQEEKEKEARQKASSVKVTPLKDVNTKHRFYDLSESTCNILNDWDFYSRESCVSVGYMSKDDIDDLFKHEADAKIIVDWVFSDYATLYEEFCEIDGKHDRATKMIASMKEEISKLEAKIDELSSKKREAA